MPPETKDLMADRLLKPTGKRKRQDHHHHADDRSTDTKPDNKPRKRPGLVESNPFSYETCYVQMDGFRVQKYSERAIRQYFQNNIVIIVSVRPNYSV